MATPVPEISALKAFLTAVGLTYLLGYDPFFWWVVGLVTVIKILDPKQVSPIDPNTGKKFVGRRYMRLQIVNILGAVIPPIALTKGIAELLGINSTAIELIIGLVLVLGGHGLLNWLQTKASSPDALFDRLLNRFVGPPSQSENHNDYIPPSVNDGEED